MRFRGDEVQFAAVGLEDHRRRGSGELEAREEDATLEIHGGNEAFLPTDNERHGIVRQDGHVFRGFHDGNDGLLCEAIGVIDAQRGVAAIDDENVFAVGGAASEHRTASGVRGRDDGARDDVDDDKGIRAGSSGIRAAAIRREIEGVGGGAHGDAGHHLV